VSDHVNPLTPVTEGFASYLVPWYEDIGSRAEILCVHRTKLHESTTQDLLHKTVRKKLQSMLFFEAVGKVIIDFLDSTTK